MAAKGGLKSILRKGPHYKWPIIDRSAERAVLVQLRKTISIYDRSGIFEDFENAYAQYHKRKHALLFSSGTSAIHAMYVAAGINEGDEVICPAYTFFATVTPLLTLGARPILCDCDENGNIDPSEIKKKLTSKTKAVIVTHMWGIPCQMDKIVPLCRKNNVLLFEDCSHAHGASLNNKIVGSFGDISAWSLQGSKNVSGGEGGILTTNNSEFYYKALLFGHYNKRCRQEIPQSHELSRYAVTGMGLKQRAHPLAVILAFQVFKKIDIYRKRRDKNAKKIINSLRNIPGLVPPELSPGMEPSWYALIFKYNSEKFGGLSVNKFCDALIAEGLVEVDRPNSTSPLNLLPIFQEPGNLFPVYKKIKLNYLPGDFPKSEKFFNQAIKLPVWVQSKDSSTVNKYILGFKKVCDNYKELL